MTETAVESSVPQHMKPTPTGKMPDGVFGMKVDWREVAASLRRDEKVERSVPAPRNPSPPALDTAAARADVEIKRMGAEATRGVEVHR
jgi:hypothetical protein